MAVPFCALCCAPVPKQHPFKRISHIHTPCTLPDGPRRPDQCVPAPLLLLLLLPACAGRLMQTQLQRGRSSVPGCSSSRLNAQPRRVSVSSSRLQRQPLLVHGAAGRNPLEDMWNRGKGGRGDQDAARKAIEVRFYVERKHHPSTSCAPFCGGTEALWGQRRRRQPTSWGSNCSC